MNTLDIIKNSFQQANLELSCEQAEQFRDYADLLAEWNQKFNLTTITEPVEIVRKHFLDSAAVCYLLQPDSSWKDLGPENVSRETFSVLFTEKVHLLDVGSGAGFPGIPLKIMFPEWEVTLLDSLNKRVTFLEAVIEKLSLSHCRAYHGRAEEAAHNNEFREQYDMVVSRAVANLSTLLEYTLPFIHKNGSFLAYKSGKVSEEIENADHALSELGGCLKANLAFQLPGTEYSRNLVWITKEKNTAAKYPRKAGTPEKKPL